MQKVITVRASQKDIEQVTAKFIAQGWHVVSVTKGSEWGRIGMSYKWTFILEMDDSIAKANVDTSRAVEDIKKESAAKSYGKTALLCVGVIAGFIVLVAIIYVAISCYI